MMSWEDLGALYNFESSPFPEHLSIASSAGRTSMPNGLSRLENKLMTRKICNF